MSFVDVVRKLKRHLNLYDVRPSDEFARTLSALSPEAVCVDCGANIGVYTLLMAETGATVHAFEPDPNARRVLNQRVRGFKNVRVHAAAVSARDGSADLFFHQNSARDPVHYSQGSSLLSIKQNVGSRSTSVEIVDLNRFINELGRDVSLLKMDIEGAEIEVLNHMIDGGSLAHVKRAFVELHDRKTPELREQTDALRNRLAAHPEFDLSWH